jgi:hypothetical protein
VPTEDLGFWWGHEKECVPGRGGGCIANNGNPNANMYGFECKVLSESLASVCAMNSDFGPPWILPSQQIHRCLPSHINFLFSSFYNVTKPNRPAADTRLQLQSVGLKHDLGKHKLEHTGTVLSFFREDV